MRSSDSRGKPGGGRGGGGVRGVRGGGGEGGGICYFCDGISSSIPATTCRQGSKKLFRSGSRREFSSNPYSEWNRTTINAQSLPGEPSSTMNDVIMRSYLPAAGVQ